jgi:hypothetical protein
MKQLIRNLVITSFFSLLIAAQAQQITLFSDNMESGTNGWTVGGSTDNSTNDGGYWHLSQRWSDTTTNTSWYYGIESAGNVGTNDFSNGYIITPSIDLSGVTNATLSFKHLPRGESDWWIDDDQVYVDVSTDDFATWNTALVGLMVGYDMWGDFTTPQMSTDLSQYAGQTIKIRFSIYITGLCGEHFDTSMCPVTEGWYVDDVTVTGQ